MSLRAFVLTFASFEKRASADARFFRVRFEAAGHGEAMS